MNFDDIRSYNDAEYTAVVTRLVNEPIFVQAIQYFFPKFTKEELEQELLSYTKINEFQANFFCRLISKVEDFSMDQLFIEGLEDITDQISRLYISNHRDIVLDSALINYGLNANNLNTSEIAIGSNLLATPWVKDLVRLNKSFIVKRNVAKQEMLNSSIQLSNYIQYVIHQKHQSVWIAQREGRAKDGNDKTNPGLLKMFTLSANEDLIDFFIKMNITPVSISYEYDPCDILKVPELLAKLKGEPYLKKEGEDNLHMITGIKGDKGNTKVVFAKSINTQIEELRGLKNRNELLKNIAQIIDTEIHRNYYLWPTNYIAFDLLNNTEQFAKKYTQKQKDQFVEILDQKLAHYQLQQNGEARQLFLKMYANPVINKGEKLL